MIINCLVGLSTWRYSGLAIKDCTVVLHEQFILKEFYASTSPLSVRPSVRPFTYDPKMLQSLPLKYMTESKQNVHRCLLG